MARRIAKGIFLVLALAAIAAAASLVGWPLLWDNLHANPSPAIESWESRLDTNGNGKSDTADIIAGARADAEACPRYDGAYVEGGYPPDDVGVCTDLVWRAFRQAGYELKDMVDADIAAHPERYPHITEPDPNIDFRRVGTLRAFFAARCEELPTSLDDASAWQPGDIVIFDDDNHIGICSDKRDSRGIPLLFHNAGQPLREENYLGRPFAMEITAHYRFPPE